MKKLILSALVLLSINAFSQKLIVTPNGLRDSSNTERTFIVINAEGKTAKQLYDNSLRYVNKNYKNPDNAIKGKTDGEYLKLDTYVPELLFIKNGGIKVFFAAKYTTELSFKDGKVKYEIIQLDMYQPVNNMPLTFTGGGLNWFIYDKKNNLKRPDAKTDIENYFNLQVKSITDFLLGKGDKDNW